MTTLFISDLHLSAERPDISAAFFEFMSQRACKADALYILGDFFEVWIGDDDPDELNQQVAQALKTFSDQGKALFLMVGNRDFLMGKQFADQCGAELLADPTVIDLYGSPTLLMHGDSLCTDDLEYMAFRQQSRSPQWQQMVLSKSLAERRALALQLRQQSKSMNSMKAEDIMDINQQSLEQVLQQHSVQKIIHGHTHRPARHDFEMSGTPCERLVLGDWGEKLWWIEADPESVKLLSEQISPA